MKFEKQSNKLWIAKGCYGKFIIKKMSGLYYGQYLSSDGLTTFNFPRKRTLTQMKELMKENFYWE